MKPILIAEIAQGHDGSVGFAKSFVKLAKDVGADYVKFQTHMAEFETSEYDDWRVKFSDQDASRYSYWKRMEFSEEEWFSLRHYCNQLNIGFISSPFSVEAVNLLNRLEVPFFKIASGEVSNVPMLEEIKRSKKDVIISTGLSTDEQLDELVSFFGPKKVTLLHCVSEYPVPAEHAFLNKIDYLKETYPHCRIGLSDHSGEVYPSLLAIDKGIDVLELHITFDKRLFGPDTSSSLTAEQFSIVKNGVTYINRMKSVSESELAAFAANKKKMSSLFGHSAFASRDIFVGETINTSDIRMKKPGIGLPYSFFDMEEVHASIIIKEGTLITKDMLS